MKEFLIFLYRTSRPRFWLYLGGTYVVGFAAGAPNVQAFTELYFWVYLFFFLVPANIFLYGINDYYDADTDQFNTKKGNEENLLQTTERKKLRLSLCVIAGLCIVILTLSHSAMLASLFGIFLVLSYFYSAPPLRFKARPVLDFASNILYGLPGIIGYLQTSGHLPSWPIVIAVFFWTSAMHLFSAIPDIASDQKAGLTTSAIFFGQKASLYICSLLWLTSLVIFVAILHVYWLGAICLAYPLVPLFLVGRPALLQRVYWYFPAYNAAVGFALFSLAILH